MPKQKGFLKLEGTYDDVTFMKTQDGYIAKKKSSISKQRIKTDKKFQRTRENNAEFTNAAKAGKLLRNSINTLLKDAKDNRVTSRLMKLMMVVAKSDPESVRGSRTTAKGDVSLLEKFDFNVNAPLTNAIKMEPQAQIDRAQGQLKVDLQQFIPTQSVTVPDGCTHFKIVSAGVELDFEKESYVANNTETEALPWDSNPVQPLTLTTAVTAASTKPLLLVLGLQFFQRSNGKDYPLQSGAYNALSIIKTLAA